MDSNLNVQWSEFGSHLTSSFPALLSSNAFVDVTLVTCDGKLRCHRLVLAAASDLFVDMLSTEEMANNSNFVYLKGIDIVSLRHVVNFVYNGYVDIAGEQLEAFLNAAKELRIKGINDHSKLGQAINDNNNEANNERKLETSNKVNKSVVDSKNTNKDVVESKNIQQAVMECDETNRSERPSRRCRSATKVFTVVGLDRLGNLEYMEGVGGVESALQQDEGHHQSMEEEDVHSKSDNLSRSAKSSRPLWKREYEVTRKYQKRWELLYPWVTKALDGSERPFCKVCKMSLTCKSHALSTHQLTAKHMKRIRDLI